MKTEKIQVMVTVNAIVIGLGTTGKEVVERLYDLMKQRGPAGVVDWVRLLTFDYTDQAGNSQSKLPAGTAIPTIFNKARVKVLAAKGWLWNIQKALWSGNGILQQGKGAGNKPRNGAYLFKLQVERFMRQLEAHMRHFLSHAAQREHPEGGMKQSQERRAMPVFVVHSGVGGMGCGALPPCLEAICEVAKQLANPVKVVDVILPYGSIADFNHEQAIENQNELGKYLVAASLGVADNMQMTGDGGGPGPLVQSVIMNSNVNDQGEISSFRALVMTNAEFLYAILCTPLGEVMNASVINAEACTGPDALGIPAIGKTGSVSVMNVDCDKTLDFAAHRLAGDFLGALVTADNPKGVREGVAPLLQSLNLLEGIEGSPASHFIRHPKELGGVDAPGHAQAAFQKGLRGYRGAKRRGEAVRRLGYMEQVAIPGNYQPQIQHQADTLLATAWEGIQERQAEFDRQKSGPANRAVALEECRQRVHRYREYNRQQLTRLTADRQTIHRRLGAMRDRIAKNARRFWLWRWLFSLPLWQRVRHLEEDASRIITVGVEIAARKALDERVYGPLLDLLAEAAREAHEVLAILTETGHVCAVQTDEVLHKPSSETVPLGVELADANFLQEIWPRLVDECNGLEDLTQRLSAAYREKYPSTAVLLKADAGRLLDGMLCDAESYFAAAVKRLNVADVFKQRYPTREQQCNAMLECVKESQGRLHEAEGETDHREKWIKIVSGPTLETVEYLQKILAEVDSTWGDWKTAITGDPQRISFWQMRAGISLTTLYTDPAPNSNGKTVRQLAECGADPITALLPGLKPTHQDAETTLLKASILGMASTDNGRGIVLQVQPDDEPEPIGEGESAITSILCDFPRMVRINWAHARLVRRRYAEVVASLERFRGNGSEIPAILRDIISSAAVERVWAEVQELHRYFSARMEG